MSAVERVNRSIDRSTWAWWMLVIGLAALALVLSVLVAGAISADPEPLPTPGTTPTVFLPPG